MRRPRNLDPDVMPGDIVDVVDQFRCDKLVVTDVFLGVNHHGRPVTYGDAGGEYRDTLACYWMSFRVRRHVSPTKNRGGGHG